MKQVLISLSLLFLQIGMNAQSLADPLLEVVAKQVIYDVIDESIAPQIEYVGLVIMDTAGRVKANVSLQYDSIAKFKDYPEGNGRYYYSGLGRPLLYMCLVPKYRSPSYVVDTGNGIFEDSITGNVFLDSNWKHGGYGKIDLKHGVDRSNICMIKAAICFKDSVATLAREMQETGIFFGAQVSDTFWYPNQIFETRMSLLQQTAWVNGLYSGKIQMRLNETESLEPIAVISNKEGSDSLRAAMELAVKDGLCRTMNSKLVQVAGISNVSPPDIENKYGCFAACVFPANAPEYCVGVYVNIQNPAGRLFPLKIARNIIDFITMSYLNRQIKTNVSSDYPKRRGRHPAEK